MSTAKRWFIDCSTEKVIALARLEQLNPVDHMKIITAFDDYEAFCRASTRDLAAAGLTNKQAQVAQYYGLLLDCSPVADLDTPEGQILHLITDTSRELDELVVETGLDVKKILGLVTRLELSGRIYQDSAGRYSTKKHG